MLASLTKWSGERLRVHNESVYIVVSVLVKL